MYIPIINYLKKSEFPTLIQAISEENAYQAIIDEYNTRISLLKFKIKKIEREQENNQNNILVSSLLKTLAQREYLLINEINHLLDKLIISPFTDQNSIHQSYLDEVIALFGIKRATIYIEKDKTKLESNEQLIKKMNSRLEILSSTGTKGAYKHHLLSLDTRILDVSINKQENNPGKLEVILLINSEIALSEEEKNIFLIEIKEKIKEKDLICLRDEMDIKFANPVKISIKISFNDQADAKQMSIAKQKIKEIVKIYTNEKYKLNTAINTTALLSLIEDDGLILIKDVYFYIENENNKIKDKIFKFNEVPVFNEPDFN